MSKEKLNDQIVKYCVHCGAEIIKDQAYCPKCGKLVIKIKPSINKDQKAPSIPSKPKTEIPARTCKSCGSIIKSSILEQCPICNAKLEKIPKELVLETTQASPKKTGFIFSEKKLVPEQKFILKKDVWNLREGVAVFGNSLLAYVIIRFLIIILIEISGTTGLNITNILLFQIPDIIFGVYPLWYIYSKKHNIKKLGLFFKTKLWIIAIAIGVTGAFALILLDNFSSLLIQFMYDSGIDFFNVFEYLADQVIVIKNTNLFWFLLLIALVSLSVLSTELVFRGVLHNSLKMQFENNLSGRVSIILIVALIYAGLFLLFSWPEGIYFFIINFIVFIVLGILFEINGNLLNSIIANALYQITFIVFIYLF